MAHDTIALTVISESILEGERVRLRPVQPGDLPKFAEWLADPEVRRWLAALNEPPTLQDEVEWYEDTPRQPGQRPLGDRDARRPADRHDRAARWPRTPSRAELGIAIQDKSQWSQGYGTDDDPPGRSSTASMTWS